VGGPCEDFVLLQFALYEIIIRPPYRAWRVQESAAFLDRLPHLLAPLPLAPWRASVAPTDFFAGRGLLVAVTREDADLYWIQAAALWRGALRDLDPLELAWNSFDG
jgi:hypothetical protein